MTKETFLICINESSIKRNTKLRYFLGIKGVPIEAKTTLFKGSVRIIMDICSNGSWISFIINETINSNIYLYGSWGSWITGQILIIILNIQKLWSY